MSATNALKQTGKVKSELHEVICSEIIWKLEPACPAEILDNGEHFDSMIVCCFSVLESDKLYVYRQINIRAIKTLY